MARKSLSVDALTHDEDSRKNAPTAELEPFVDEETKRPILAAYERRNPDLDPQLVWRGKDVADWSDLVVKAPPLYIQEKIHPKAIIEDLKRASQRKAEPEAAPDLFADFNGLDPEQRTEFYAHDQHWSNRMILGDGLQVMASLAERENLKGQVQCIYIDPPYGIKFNSNFQWSTTSRDVKDGKADHLTREPEQVKAFRDTWRDGIHSYLTYLRDRLTVARDLLTESGSVFVQIGDENVHRVRALMDEVFGEENFVAQISVKKTSGATSEFLPGTVDYILFFAKRREALKFRQAFHQRKVGEDGDTTYTYFDDHDGRRMRLRAGDFSALTVDQSKQVFRLQTMTSQSVGRSKGEGAASWFPVGIVGRNIRPPRTARWKTNETGMRRLVAADRIEQTGNSISYVRFHGDFPVFPVTDFWNDTQSGSAMDKLYVVQTSQKIIERCILMTTDPGDLVLDPTCGSGTTAYVAEQWGRRWITIDTSRVALALARARLMGARYSWYLLADSPEGQRKEAEVTRSAPSTQPTYGRLRQGFVYRRVPHITLKSIANNAEIDTIWADYQRRLEPLRRQINAARGRFYKDEAAGYERENPHELPPAADPARPPFEEWSMPRAPGSPWPEAAAKALEKTRSGSKAARTKWLAKVNELLGRSYTLESLPEQAVDPWDDPETEELHAEWWRLRIARQQEIDRSIAAKADHEYLYDQPYEDKTRVRVAGPFTVESLSPHRVPAVDVDDSLYDELEAAEGRRQKDGSGETADFVQMILENLKKAGVQQAHKADRLAFESLELWPGRFICAEGRVRQASLEEAEGEGAGPTRRAAILVGPEYGTLSRADLVAAAREAAEAGFDLLIAAAFNYDAHASEFDRMGPLTVLQARINPDLHMPDLANTGAGNLFTVFGEPDIALHEEEDDCISIEVLGVDMYKGGQIESGEADDIAVWFLDTDYDYENFRVRHAYFPGTNDPYKALKTTLKAEIDEEAWSSLNRTRSRPFPRPESGRVAVKVINHLGDEVMKVIEV